MKISLSWLKQYIDFNYTAEELSELFTLIGLEVEHIDHRKLPFEKIITAQVTETAPHPDADKLCIAQVFDGSNTHQVVCGASNCRKDLVTAFAPVGSLIEHDGKTITIKKAKLRGVESFGMLCSAKELGISDDNSGIMDMPGTSLGMDLKSLFEDTILDISLTPNLGHCMSTLGIAREMKVFTLSDVEFPQIYIEEDDNQLTKDLIEVSIDTDHCYQYSARYLYDLQSNETPAWMKKILEDCGQQSINLVVDVLNYTMLEIGQPMHAFDYDRLPSKKIRIAENSDNIELKTLDGQKREIPSGTLMIYDNNEPLAVAGIIGGDNSSITESTTNILLEAAYFCPSKIRKGMKNLNLRTESSARFEKGIDQLGIELALDRASSLIQQYGKAKIAKDVSSTVKTPYKPRSIKGKLSNIERILGISLSYSQVEGLLGRIDIKCSKVSDTTYSVTPPSYRNDIHEEIDVIEEIARVHGYNNIPIKSTKYEGSNIPHDPLYLFESNVRNFLLFQNLQEFLTCDLISPKESRIGSEHEKLISVLHAKSVDQSILRSTFLPGLLTCIKRNQNQSHYNFAGFEIGKLHFKDEGKFKERSATGIILAGNTHAIHWEEKPKAWDFFHLKGKVEGLFEYLKIENLTFAKTSYETFHPGRQAKILIKDVEVGVIGEIHPQTVRDDDIKNRVLYAELNNELLLKLSPHHYKMKSLPVYPAMERDLTFTFTNELVIDHLFKEIKSAKTAFLEDFQLIDIYKSKEIGKKVFNATLRFRYRDSSKTLKQEIVDQELETLVSHLKTALASFIKQ